MKKARPCWKKALTALHYRAAELKEMISDMKQLSGQQAGLRSQNSALSPGQRGVLAQPAAATY